MVEIFLWIDESEANTSFVKFGCCLMMEMVKIMVILMIVIMIMVILMMVMVMIMVILMMPTAMIVMKTTCIPAYPPPMMSTWMLATASLLLAPDPILSFSSEAENAFYTISYALETKNIC